MKIQILLPITILILSTVLALSTSESGGEPELLDLLTIIAIFSIINPLQDFIEVIIWTLVFIEFRVWRASRKGN